MAPSPSADRLAPADAEVLLDLAEAAIAAGHAGVRLAPAPLATLPPALRRPAGAFVTLRVAGELNGCIGSIEPVEPLAHAVARHARSAAFADPRLPPLRPDQHDRLDVEISVLSPLVPLPGESRDAVLAALRPGVDGLLIAAGGRQAVFLPAVWEQLPDPEVFLAQLEAKARLRPGRWPRTLRAWRFTTATYTRRARGRQAGVLPYPPAS
ncbi:MAG TPA: AmmeMemoRadiSam system protein A [Acidimicrobiales bacterium]|nr:AmmeMemoRadiSam system protein A [Acidimicrobiales bacterium]